MLSAYRRYAMNDTNDTKQCSKCKQYKSTSEFCRHKYGRDGIDSQCKKCKAEYKRWYRLAFPDKARAEWRRKSKESHAATERNRRARKKNAGGSHTSSEIKWLYDLQHGRCVYCGVCLGEKYHVDHIVPISKGGRNDLANLQILCQRCNDRKSNKMPEVYELEIELYIQRIN